MVRVTVALTTFSRLALLRYRHLRDREELPIPSVGPVRAGDFIGQRLLNRIESNNYLVSFGSLGNTLNPDRCLSYAQDPTELSDLPDIGSKRCGSGKTTLSIR